eukprot:6170-Eustigmatos_ZCMA.PRE.1
MVAAGLVCGRIGLAATAESSHGYIFLSLAARALPPRSEKARPRTIHLPQRSPRPHCGAERLHQLVAAVEAQRWLAPGSR